MFLGHQRLSRLSLWLLPIRPWGRVVGLDHWRWPH
jgi:hypothetical protein